MGQLGWLKEELVFGMQSLSLSIQSKVIYVSLLLDLEKASFYFEINFNLKLKLNTKHDASLHKQKMLRSRMLPRLPARTLLSWRPTPRRFFLSCSSLFSSSSLVSASKWVKEPPSKIMVSSASFHHPCTAQKRSYARRPFYSLVPVHLVFSP